MQQGAGTHLIAQLKTINAWHVNVRENKKWQHLCFIKKIERGVAIFKKNNFIRVVQTHKDILQNLLVIFIVLNYYHRSILTHKRHIYRTSYHYNQQCGFISFRNRRISEVDTSFTVESFRPC